VKEERFGGTRFLEEKFNNREAEISIRMREGCKHNEEGQIMGIYMIKLEERLLRVVRPYEREGGIHLSDQ
jgi:hypothetical protein